ncbi:PKD domain-containing protein [Tamlana sp. 62-3]|uniref:PKD domain-containing protein n=1 Tax=Neotamlana sargassicola TaxID=2883125 RepID=A0A9X1L8E4_9FLAO|nr:GEVED domain-containing protein [Tamlana sargassicola]MCB4808788.1 PKD domain-containing protein [Tamlana sargassicola]
MSSNQYRFACILFLCFLFGKLTNGQVLTQEQINNGHCGSYLFHNHKMETDEIYKLKYQNAIGNFNKISASNAKVANGILQVPVVIHVMHKGEEMGTGTNISDTDIKQGLKYLNNYWRKVSGSNGDGNGVDMQIEFVLTVQDESGNCTNGINRVDMSGVDSYVNNGVNSYGSGGLADYIGDSEINSLKEYGNWNPNNYYNVWLVDEIDNENCYSGGSYTSGYAYFAGAHGQAFDGAVVLMCSFLSESSSTWAHEMGHAFNLPHTFDGDDANNDGVADQCGDDGIFDTPSHMRTNSISPSIYYDCDTSVVNSCDADFNETINPDTGFVRNSGTHQDHIFNYMDYTGCASEFTGGQRTVVINTLTTTRASYLSSPALIPPDTATVFFSASSSTACLGETITFTDESSCTPNTYTNNGYDDVSFSWTFNNGVDTPITSTLQNPSITFTNLGNYDVTLEVTNPEGTTSLTKTSNIAVTNGVVSGCAISSATDDSNVNCGVTNITFNTINNSTTTVIPEGALNDFTCDYNTSVFLGENYDLEVEYKSRSDGNQYLEVWIDWDNNGAFEAINSQGDSEMVLSDNIIPNYTGTATASISPPISSVLNTLLRMRVVTDLGRSPVTCGNGYVLRADDYGVYVKPACTAPSAGITNNSSTTVLTCNEPSISLTATGGSSYNWDNNKGIDATITVTEPGTYTVTVTSSDGCTDIESIVITENKPNPTAEITSENGQSAFNCDIASIDLTASGGVSYVWDNGLGTNASITVTEPGIYTVTVTDANGCTDTESIELINSKTEAICDLSSFYDGGNYGCGVTNLTFNTIDKATSTYIPNGAVNDFICSDNTTLISGMSYQLDVTYNSRTDGSEYLEVWIDWDSNGEFETSNSNGNNEQVLVDNIGSSTVHTASTGVVVPASAISNTLLKMRVVTDYNQSPVICGDGFVLRGDDYGITVSNSLSTVESLVEEHIFKIYPNPANNYLNVFLSNSEKISSFKIYDVFGKIILKNELQRSEQINISKLQTGIYFIKVKTETKDYVSKFLKE